MMLRSLPAPQQHLNNNYSTPQNNNAPSSQHTFEAHRPLAAPQQTRTNINNGTNTNNSKHVSNMTTTSTHHNINIDTSTPSTEHSAWHVSANAESNPDKSHTARLDEGLLQRLRSAYKITTTLLVSFLTSMSFFLFFLVPCEQRCVADLWSALLDVAKRAHVC
jgi:hypothetical protein